ncbi:MAG: hypothetical protein A3G32_06350 [Deltaproteobacteria bacterium RIFCSPLOWO2_12_FULL_40_28]|nr:MAG: hypothetical protein A3C45_02445 [Deltaproteobacteria bacterium RIFCSPHIGHO2_02_FULL_40_28]OGQ19073.1 MAG: hypothetical protein A3E27_05535 [Deltaproteobacteria bacterium RIFCSPHIGHO2_12_FULL_40_32]OGQ40245.1 MAG: hypothetical protein A3I69_00975 [Deltaproteobacteria bacterium RIFCSPLOWO2_02_FULL_40_36]OGQ53516.1 MAG: hypothetical protein A3G32_06350 [Deltaproteobacteria bacterium RIFCSPLOWO2_12_FULL_40_28]
MKKWASKISPWIIAVLILYLLFKQVPPATIWISFQKANWLLFFFLSITYFLILFFLDSLGLAWVISRFAHPISYKESLLLRAGTYFLMPLNYNLAQASMAGFLKKTHGAPFFKTLGSVAFLSAADLIALTFLAFISVLIFNPTLGHYPIQSAVLGMGGALLGSFFLWAGAWQLVKKPIMAKWTQKKIIRWIVENPIFFAFRQAKPSDYIKIFLLRIPCIFFVVLSFSFPLLVFGARIPLGILIATTPIILMAGTLPITPAGLGTVQLLCVEFYKNHLTSPWLETGALQASEIILVGSLAWVFANLTWKGLVGLSVFLSSYRKLFQK